MSFMLGWGVAGFPLVAGVTTLELVLAGWGVLKLSSLGTIHHVLFRHLIASLGFSSNWIASLDSAELIDALL